MRHITFTILACFALAACAPTTRRPLYATSNFEERDLLIQVVDADTQRPVGDVEVEKILVMTVPGTFEMERTVLARKHTSSDGEVSFPIDRNGVIFTFRKRGYETDSIFPTGAGYADIPPEPDEQNGRITFHLRPRP